MSVLSPRADMPLLNRDVRRVPKPDLIGSSMPARGQYARLRQLDGVNDQGHGFGSTNSIFDRSPFNTNLP